MTTLSDIQAISDELGFAGVGIAPAAASAYPAELRSWLDAGQHGSMSYLAEHFEKRVDPAVLLPGARALICVADRYSDGTRDRPQEPRRGRIARYARGDDYHTVMKKRLFVLADRLRDAAPDAEFKVCVDTAPVLEREHAQRAGLGAVGKHTLLLQRGAGSYLLLGEIVTTLDLPVSEPSDPDPCGTCTRCIDACPTDAITPWSVDATKCISYLTIEHRESIAPALRHELNGWIFGCDICQEVCPHTRPTRKSRRLAVHEAYEEKRTSFDLLEVLNWSEEDRRAAFTKSSMKRAKLNMMKRNALLLAGDVLAEHDDDALRERVASLVHDESEDALVRETAAIVMERLTST